MLLFELEVLLSIVFSVLFELLFITLFYAVLDEYHQIFVIGRGSSVKDVLIDFIGGIIGMAIYYIVYYLSHRIRKVRKT